MGCPGRGVQDISWVMTQSVCTAGEVFLWPWRVGSRSKEARPGTGGPLGRELLANLG